MGRDIELVADPGRPRAWTLRVEGVDQSHVDLDDPTHLEFDYIARMADALDEAYPPPTRIRVVHIGGAAMTFARYVATTRPTSAQIVLEPDSVLTAYVREHLPLPPRSGIKVRDVDGRTGLVGLRAGAADVVVLDAYDGPRVPPDLTTTEAFTQMVDALAPTGMLLANIADRAPFDYARRVVAAITACFPAIAVSAEPATLRGRRFGNLLVMASRTPVPVDGLRRRAASSPFPYRVLSRAAQDGRFSGGRPLTDADPGSSPPPPGGAAFFR